MTTIDPEALVELTYSAGRPKLIAEAGEDCCPSWEELPPEQVDAMVASARDTIAVLKANGYDIVKTGE